MINDVSQYKLKGIFLIQQYRFNEQKNEKYSNNNFAS